jgi:hypothetical protein
MRYKAQGFSKGGALYLIAEKKRHLDGKLPEDFHAKSSGADHNLPDSYAPNPPLESLGRGASMVGTDHNLPRCKKRKVMLVSLFEGDASNTSPPEDAGEVWGKKSKFFF